MIHGNLLLRYLEERPFVDMFMDGHIRLNSLNFFWGEHDEPTKIGQIDTMEGMVCPVDARSADDCSRADGYKYCNLLCCNCLSYIQEGNTVGWYINWEMSQFGDFVVIIKNPDEFQSRLVAAASEQGYSCLCNRVDYNNTIDASRDVFNKAADFAYQNEWRAALYRGVDEIKPCVLDIGPIDDIAEWCYTKDLDRCITRIFYEHDFHDAAVAMHGNISRPELAKFFTAN